MNHPATTPRQTSHCHFGINIGNHNETLITRRSGLSENHNEALIAAGRAWPHPEYRIPVTAAPAR